MWSLAVAEWRTTWWLNLLGVGLMGGLAALIHRELAREACCPPDVERQIYLTRLLFVSIVYCHVPMVVYSQNGLYGSRSRQFLGQTLPLSTTDQNASRMLTALLFLPVGLVASAAFVWLWWHFGLRVSPWLFVSATIAPIGFLFVCMRRSVLRYTIPFVFAFIWVPGSEVVAWPLLHVAGSAWGATGLAVAVAVAARWTLRQSPPRWTRGCV